MRAEILLRNGKPLYRETESRHSIKSGGKTWCCCCCKTCGDLCAHVGHEKLFPESCKKWPRLMINGQKIRFPTTTLRPPLSLSSTQPFPSHVLAAWPHRIGRVRAVGLNQDGLSMYAECGSISKMFSAISNRPTSWLHQTWESHHRHKVEKQDGMSMHQSCRHSQHIPL